MIDGSDSTLVQAARSGDKTAFSTLIARHHPLLLNLCRRMLGDPILAEDAAQDAIVQAFLSLDRLRHADRFGPWLAGIGLNICRRWLQHRSRDGWSLDALYSGDALPELPDWQPGPEDLIEAADLRERIRFAVDELPPDNVTQSCSSISAI